MMERGEVPCAGQRMDGKPCRLLAKAGSDFCHLHRAQEANPLAFGRGEEV